MCGIVGVLAYNTLPKPAEKIRQESMIFLTSELLQLTQPRGKDATGVAVLFSNGDYMGLKMGIGAQEFVTRFGPEKTDFEGFLNVWRRKSAPAKIVLGHCRKPSTVGFASATDNANNHPIRVENIVGIHNGTLDNPEQIFKRLGCDRDGKVDSEAIFRLLHHYTQKGNEPFTMDVLRETCKRLDGQYATLAFSGNNPYQLAAARDSRPIEMAIIRPLKLMLIASEKDILKKAVARYVKMGRLYQPFGLKFVPICKADFEMTTMPDDHMFLFDIREDITADTKPDDLYTKEKIDRTTKIWQKKTNNVYKGNYANPNQQKKATVTAGTGIPARHTVVCSKKTKTVPGGRNAYIWNNKELTYTSIPAEEINESKKVGAVIMRSDSTPNIIDAVTGKEIAISDQKKGNKIEVAAPLKNKNTAPAKIEVLPMVIKPAFKNEHTDNSSNVCTSTMDMTTYPDVIEKATEVTRALPSFADDEEVADALEVRDAETLKRLQLYSLANRIKSFFFKYGWYAGYIARLKEEKSGSDNSMLRNMMLRGHRKNVRSRDTIRSIKSFTKILATFIDNGSRNVGSQEMNDAVQQVIEGLNLEIKPEVLGKVFRSGDRRSSNIIGGLMEHIEEKIINKE